MVNISYSKHSNLFNCLSLLAIGGVVDKLNVGSVAYSICFHSRLKQVIFGIPEGKSLN